MYFYRSDRIRAPRWMLCVGLGAALLTAIILIPDGAPLAQTSNSLRIRSLGDSFAGIIEDPHTDAYLNPARVGDLRDRQIYMARLPGESLTFYYPDNTGVSIYGNYVLPPETVPGYQYYSWPESFTPYTIGFVTPLSGSTKLSLSLDMAANGVDDLNHSNDLRVSTYGGGSDRIDLESYTNGSEYSLYHVVADAAIGTGNPESEGVRVGVRFRLGYDQMQSGRVRVDERIRFGYPDTNDMDSNYSYDRQIGDYDNTTAQLSVGLHRNSGFFSQAVLGGVWQRETLVNTSFARRIEDEDADGNGVGFYGDMTPLYSVVDHKFNASRSYDGVMLFGRLGLRWSDRVRSFHRVTWKQSNGNGTGFVAQDFYSSEVIIDDQYSAVSYDLDGTTTGFTTDHSVGIVNTIGDNLQVTLGVHARIEYEEFEEDGDGNGSLSITEGTSTNTFDAPYSQRATLEREYLLLNLPMGVEWNFYRSMAWRFGTQIRATRTENTGEIGREIDLIDDPGFGENPSFRDIDKRITYGTSLYFSMGFGLTLWDKLSIDLLTAATTGSFNAATIASAQVKYFF